MEYRDKNGEIITVGSFVKANSGRKGEVTKLRYASYDKADIRQSTGEVFEADLDCVVLIRVAQDVNQTQTKKEVVDMDAAIVAVYGEDKTKDAVLVDDHFSAELKQSFKDEFTRTLWLKEHKSAYLAEAKKREEVEKEDEA